MSDEISLKLVVISFLGAFISFLVTILLRILIYKNKIKRHEPGISQRIKRVAEVLSDSSADLINLQQELQEKVQFVNDLNMKANQAQNLLSLSQDQLDAIKLMLNHETRKESKINFWKSVLVNFVFFVLGAIASYVISKYLV